MSSSLIVSPNNASTGSSSGISGYGTPKEAKDVFSVFLQARSLFEDISRYSAHWKLLAAFDTDDVEKIQEAVDQGAPIDLNFSGSGSIFDSYCQSDSGITHKNKRAKLTMPGQTAMHYAVFQGKTKAIDYFLSRHPQFLSQTNSMKLTPLGLFIFTYIEKKRHLPEIEAKPEAERTEEDYKKTRSFVLENLGKLFYAGITGDSEFLSNLRTSRTLEISEKESKRHAAFNDCFTILLEKTASIRQLIIHNTSLIPDLAAIVYSYVGSAEQFKSDMS